MFFIWGRDNIMQIQISHEQNKVCCFMLTTNIPRHFIPNLAAFHNCQLGNVLSTYNIKKAIIVLLLNMHFSCSSTLQVFEGSCRRESFLKASDQGDLKV
jgi:hypothetical protein